MTREKPRKITIQVDNISGPGMTNIAGEKITQIFKTTEHRHMPHMAESPPPVFVGREEDVEAVLRLLKLESVANEAGVIAAVRGMGGVGKSTLARVLAHHSAVKVALPGGVLKVEQGRTLDPLPGLHEWGRQLGLDLSTLSKPESCKVALLSALSNKRLLLIIDDVWKVEQAAWFLVGGPKCRTLITTRLLDVAIELAGANVHHLQPLSDAASLELMTRFSPGALVENAQEMPHLVSRLGGLPLALCLAGMMLEQERQIFADISTVVQKLDDYRGRMDLQPISQGAGDGDSDRSLRAVLWLSYAHLPDELVRRAFRFLGVFARKPGAFSCADVAGIWQISESEARNLLQILVSRGLVERSSRRGYFTLHTLLTDFALALLYSEELQEASDLHTNRFLAIAHQYRELEPDGWPELDIAWENIAAAADRLASCVNAASPNQGDLERMVEYATALDYVYQARKTTEVVKWFEAGVAACRLLERRVDEGWLTLVLGTHALDQGKAVEAEHLYQTSIDIFSKEGDELGILYAKGNLGTVQRVLGKYLQALEAFQQVTNFCLEKTNPMGAAIGYYNQADVKHALGQPIESLALVEQSLILLRENAGPEEILAGVLCLDASLNLERGQLEQAEDGVNEALEIASQIGAHHLRGRALAVQANLYAIQEKQTASKAALDEGIRLLALSGVREELAEAYQTAGICAAYWKKPELARQYYKTAAQIFELMGAEARVQEVNEFIQ